MFGRRPTTLSTTPRDSSPLGSARDHIQETGGTTAIMDGRHIQDAGDVCVPVGGVALHVFIHANDTHAVEPSWIIEISRRAPSARTAVLAALPGHAQGLGMRATVT